MKNTLRNRLCPHEIKLISFNKFLNKVHIKDYGVEDDGRFDLGIQYATKIHHPTDIKDSAAIYQRRVAMILQDDYTKACLTSLVFQLPVVYRFYNENLNAVLENIAKEYNMISECPKYFVKLGKRKWMMADPEDFCIMEYKGGYALVCFDVVRTKIYTIDHLSKEESDRLINLFIAEMEDELE